MFEEEGFRSLMPSGPVAVSLTMNANKYFSPSVLVIDEKSFWLQTLKNASFAAKNNWEK